MNFYLIFNNENHVQGVRNLKNLHSWGLKIGEFILVEIDSIASKKSMHPRTYLTDRQ